MVPCPEAMRIGSMVKFYTLCLLKEGPKHGYDLLTQLKVKLDSGISTSQVYPFLASLEKHGYIAVKRTGQRGKKVYRLTAEGQLFVNGFLQRFGDLVHLALEPKLRSCTHCGCKLLEGGVQERMGGRKLTFCCHHCAGSFRKMHH
ncbi:PadR family transcriptional regulator [Candidatus Woesearchaeota archaeon]|nr:PadR family transcriptional regulator [Candidatus Woesearchaeota archaeon]